MSKPATKSTRRSAKKSQEDQLQLSHVNDKLSDLMDFMKSSQEHTNQRLTALEAQRSIPVPVSNPVSDVDDGRPGTSGSGEHTASSSTIVAGPVTASPGQPGPGPVLPSSSAGPSAPPATVGPSFPSTPAGKIVTQVMAVGSHLKPKVVAAIAEGKFVNFKDLLPASARSPDAREIYEGNLSSVTGSEEGTKQLFYKKVDQKLEEHRDLSWDQWVQAFMVFLGKTVETRTPDLAIRMAKHYELVHDLMKRGQDWWGYDIVFRKEVELGNANWGDILSEARDKARMQQVAPVSSQKPREDSKGKSKRKAKSALKKGLSWIPDGFCIAYHREGYCKFHEACYRSHDCPDCGGNHMAGTCEDHVDFKKPRTESLQQPFPANRPPTGNQQTGGGQSMLDFHRRQQLNNRHKLDRRPVPLSGATARSL